MSAAFQTFDIYRKQGRRWALIHNEPDEQKARRALARIVAERGGTFRLVHRTAAGETPLAL